MRPTLFSWKLSYQSACHLRNHQVLTSACSFKIASTKKSDKLLREQKSRESTIGETLQFSGNASSGKIGRKLNLHLGYFKSGILVPIVVMANIEVWLKDVMVSTEATQSANYGVLCWFSWCEPGQVVWTCMNHNSVKSDGLFQLTDILMVVVENYGLV